MVTNDEIKTNNLPISDKIKTNKLLILDKIKTKTATKIQKIIDKSKSYGTKSVIFQFFTAVLDIFWIFLTNLVHCNQKIGICAIA